MIGRDLPVFDRLTVRAQRAQAEKEVLTARIKEETEKKLIEVLESKKLVKDESKSQKSGGKGKGKGKKKKGGKEKGSASGESNGQAKKGRKRLPLPNPPPIRAFYNYPPSKEVVEALSRASGAEHDRCEEQTMPPKAEVEPGAYITVSEGAPILPRGHGALIHSHWSMSAVSSGPDSFRSLRAETKICPSHTSGPIHRIPYDESLHGATVVSVWRGHADSEMIMPKQSPSKPPTVLATPRDSPSRRKQQLRLRTHRELAVAVDVNDNGDNDDDDDEVTYSSAPAADHDVSQQEPERNAFPVPHSSPVLRRSMFLTQEEREYEFE
jgi:hypothetical protein